MFSYMMIGTNDLDRAIRFYDAVMDVLGHLRLDDDDGSAENGGDDNGGRWASWGLPDPGPHITVGAPFDKNKATSGNGMMISFLAATRADVDRFHRAAIIHGGSDEGAPGLRPQYGPTFYAAYVRDPDGNKLNAVCYDEGEGQVIPLPSIAAAQATTIRISVMRSLAFLLATALALAVPGLAHAHLIQAGAAGFGSGFTHPLTGPDHFLAMFAVGLWGAQMGGRPVWTLPVVFPLIMVVGGILGILGVPIPGIETGIALSILALGLAIATAWRPPEWIALLLISVFAICHGHAHGAELPDATDPADYAIGFVIATGLIHILGIGVGLILHKPFNGRLAQVLGGIIALGGVYYLLA